MHSAKSIIAALIRERRWLEKQVDKWRPAVELTGRRNDLRSACVTILQESPEIYSRWIGRRGRRELIQRTRRWTDPKAIRALCELVDLAIGDVEACRPFMPKRRCGPLRIVASTLTDAARAKARQARQAKRQQEDDALQRRIEARQRNRPDTPTLLWTPENDAYFPGILAPETTTFADPRPGGGVDSGLSQPELL